MVNCAEDVRGLKLNTEIVDFLLLEGSGRRAFLIR